MTAHVLLDTGPLVAFLNRSDRFHDWARMRFGDLTPPLLTCEAVLAEACFLLRRCPGGSAAVMEFLKRGLLVMGMHIEDQVEPIHRLMSKYATVPMSLADACMVRMTEIEPRGTVFTLDSDFRIYKRHGRQTIPLITLEGS